MNKIVREIISLDMNVAQKAFSEYFDGANLDCMNDLSVLQESPFIDQRS